MGQEQATLNPTALKTALREAKARINIRRGQRLNEIAKKKKEIRAHLESGNEMMALIHVKRTIIRIRWNLYCMTKEWYHALTSFQCCASKS